MDKKILVTGGSGLIGPYLKDVMPSANYVSSKDYNLLNESGYLIINLADRDKFKPYVQDDKKNILDN